MIDTNRAYVITRTNAEGTEVGPKLVAVGVSEQDAQVPTGSGVVQTKMIGYWVNSPTAPDRRMLAGEVRRSGDLVIMEDLRPVFLGDQPVWWLWEPLTLESWERMLPDIAGYENLSRMIKTNADLVNYYVTAFAPEVITDDY